MKKIQQIFIISLAVLSVSCSNVDMLFEVDAETELRVELGLSTNDAHYYPNPNILIPYTSTLNATGFSKDDISKFIASRATLRPKFAEIVNLDFIHNVNVFIIDPNDTSRRKEIFYQENIQFGEKNEIRLFNTLNDITDFIANDRAIIETRLELRQFPPSSFDMLVDMTFTALAEE